MRAVVQRVSRAKVTVNDKVVGEIGRGLLVLLGVAETDETSDAEYLAEKILNLRIFEDADDKMNLSLLDSNCELLVVSQFTLYGDTRRGRRPTFIAAAGPDKAKELYEYFVARSRESVTKVETGQFQAMMDVELVNDGPVTIILDSEKTI
jgi:D-tyrosyl-tRNA(Tyr) deacylase